METEHITALRNLQSSPFSRDCYFYYLVPDEELESISAHFNDVNWIEYSRLNHEERLQYRKANCRSGSSSNDDAEDDDYDDNDSTVSVAESLMEEEECSPLIAPFYGLSHSLGKNTWMFIKNSEEFKLLMHVFLVVILVKLIYD